MAYCGQCGAKASGRFCGNCGAPTADSAPSAPRPQQPRTGRIPAEVPAMKVPPQDPWGAPPAVPPGEPHRRRRGAWVPAAVSLVVVVAAVAILALWHPWTFGSDDAQAATAAPTSSDESPTTSAPSSVAAAAPQVSRSQPTTTTSSHTPSARRQLSTLRAKDLAGFMTDGHWLVQLSSKCDGIVDKNSTTGHGGHTFADPDILAETRSLHSDFGDDVRLLSSTDFGTQLAVPCHGSDKTLWTTVYDPDTFDDRASANAWCTANFGDKKPLADFCFPRQATAPHH